MQVKLLKPTEHPVTNSVVEPAFYFPPNLLDLVSDAVIEVDTGLVIRGWNHRAEEIFGWTISESVGRLVTDYLPKPYGSFVINASVNLWSHGCWRGQISVNARDGRLLAISVTCIQVRDSAGKPSGAVAVIRDTTALDHAVSERGQARQALQQQEKLLRLINENITEFVWMTDLQHRVIYATPSVTQMFGYEVAGLLGKPLPFMADDCLAGSVGIRELLARGLTPENLARPDFRLLGTAVQTVKRKDGMTLWLESTLTIMRDADGHPEGIMGVGRDVTERISLEKEQHKLQKLNDLSLLAGGVAHDFNNILTAVMTNVALARDEADPAERLEMLGDAEAACQRAAGLTRQLLAFSRGVTTLRENVDLPGLLREISQFALRGSTVKCHIVADEGLWQVELDRAQVSQVILNLVINAREAMPGGGRILVRAVNMFLADQSAGALPAGCYIRIDVEDTGTGIRAEDLPRIFEPYFTTKASGSGLGLAVCHKAVTRHGGAITVESKVGQGTIFRVYLPARSASPEVAGVKPCSLSAGPVSSPLSSSVPAPLD